MSFAGQNTAEDENPEPACSKTSCRSDLQILETGIPANDSVNTPTENCVSSEGIKGRHEVQVRARNYRSND